MTDRSFAARARRFFSGYWSLGALRNLPGRELSRASSPDQLVHPFDITHRVDTSGLFYAEDLSSGHANDQHSAGYYATAPSLLHGAIARWSSSILSVGLALNDYTLLDIGCGKGRVVLLASECAFRTIVGVELNPSLARIANKNLKRWMRKPRACGDVKIVNDDFFSVAIPDGPVVLYLFNSFEHELVQRLLDRLLEISATRSHPIDLIYIHPEFGEIFRETPRAAILADEEISFSAEDAAADAFGVSFDRCSIYRLEGLLPFKNGKLPA